MSSPIGSPRKLKSDFTIDKENISPNKSSAKKYNALVPLSPTKKLIKEELKGRIKALAADTISFFEGLPLEMVKMIQNKLPLSELPNLRLVCRFWNQTIVNDSLFWKQAFYDFDVCENSAKLMIQHLDIEKKIVQSDLSNIDCTWIAPVPTHSTINEKFIVLMTHNPIDESIDLTFYDVKGNYSLIGREKYLCVNEDLERIKFENEKEYLSIFNTITNIRTNYFLDTDGKIQKENIKSNQTVIEQPRENSKKDKLAPMIDEKLKSGQGFYVENDRIAIACILIDSNINQKFYRYYIKDQKENVWRDTERTSILNRRDGMAYMDDCFLLIQDQPDFASIKIGFDTITSGRVVRKSFAIHAEPAFSIKLSQICNAGNFIAIGSTASHPRFLTQKLVHIYKKETDTLVKIANFDICHELETLENEEIAIEDMKLEGHLFTCTVKITCEGKTKSLFFIKNFVDGTSRTFMQPEEVADDIIIENVSYSYCHGKVVENITYHNDLECEISVISLV